MVELRIHLLEHDPIDLSDTNITIWAKENGHTLSQTFLCNGEGLPSIDDIDWLMAMGGSPHVWEEEINPWLADEKRFIAQAMENGKIILGVCLGAQLLAEVLGGEVYPVRNREVGWHDIFLTSEGKDSFLFRHIPERFLSFHWHSDHFSLPDGCTRLAYSEPTPRQAFIIKGEPIVGLQFHPEYPLEVVRHFSREFGDEWIKAPFVSDKETVLAQTEQIPETYWLMEALLNNIQQEFCAD